MYRKNTFTRGWSHSGREAKDDVIDPGQLKLSWASSSQHGPGMRTGMNQKPPSGPSSSNFRNPLSKSRIIALHFSIADFSSEMGWETKAQVVETKECQSLFSYCICSTTVPFSTIVTLCHRHQVHITYTDMCTQLLCVSWRIITINDYGVTYGAPVGPQYSSNWCFLEVSAKQNH